MDLAQKNDFSQKFKSKDLINTFGPTLEAFRYNPILGYIIFAGLIMLSFLTYSLMSIFLLYILALFFLSLITPGIYLIVRSFLNKENPQLVQDLFVAFNDLRSPNSKEIFKFCFYNFLLIFLLLFIAGISFVVLIIPSGVNFSIFLNERELAQAISGPLLPYLLVMMLIAVILFFVHFCMTWLAIPLIWFHNFKAGPAITTSIHISLTNAWPLTVWSLYALGLHALGIITIIGWIITIPLLSLWYKHIILKLTHSLASTPALEPQAPTPSQDESTELLPTP